VYPAPPSAAKKCREPLREVARAQIETLDPTGSRTRLFAKDNKDAIQVGDIVLVRQRDGDPFSGVCMIIRRAGADTAILLRAQLTRIGVEMWFKIYSPTVTGIEVVQRTKKRKRRARLYYLRYVLRISLVSCGCLTNSV
jgi:ribosomal protein L19